MKTFLITLAMLLAAGTFGTANAEQVKCTVPGVKINSSDAPEAKLAKIKDTISNYRNRFPSLRSATTGNYEICFEMETVETDETVVIEPDPNDIREIVIMGLKLKAKTAQDKPLIKITVGAENKVSIENAELSNSAALVETSGEGKVALSHSTLVGAGKGSGACVDIASPDATLAEALVTNCYDALRAGAPGMRISRSKIYGNAIGVHVLPAARGVFVEGSLIYGNGLASGAPAATRFAAIKSDETKPRDVHFLDLTGEKVARLDPGIEIAYENKPAYMLLPEAILTDSRLEIFLSGGDCKGITPPSDQACAFAAGESMFIIKAEDILKNGSASIDLPASVSGKKLVAIFTSPEYGSTAVSQVFSILSAKPVIKVVTDPSEIRAPQTGFKELAAPFSSENEWFEQKNSNAAEVSSF